MKQSSVLVKMNAKANLLPLKQANLCVRKWSTFAKVNMARVPQNKRSPLGYRKRVEQA
ncbi:MAG TPA: hypothetical protein VH330_03775 [Candidatus Udaeobacter sp.]